MIRVLVTGVGAPGTPGTLYALRNNPDSEEIYTVGIDIRSEIAGCYLVDHFRQVPSPEESSYIETLQTICREESIRVIVPQTTREIRILSNCRDAFPEVGIMVSKSEAIEIANDKWRLLQEFDKMDLPYPLYFLTMTEDELVASIVSLGYPRRPVVVKPRVSSGMRGLRIVKEDAWDVQRFLSDKPDGVELSLEELLRVLRRGDKWPTLLVTEYLAGPEYSVDAFMSESTGLGVAIPRLRQSIRSGISFETFLEYEQDDMSRYALKVARRIGLRYAFGFQFKLDEQGIPKILECNPRVQGTMVASIFSNVNIIWLAVRELLSNPVTMPPRLQPAKFYRFWGGIGVTEQSKEKI